MPSGQLASDVAALNGSQRDLSDKITIVDAKETPFFSMVPKGGQIVDSLLSEWPVDQNLTPGPNAHVDGEDVQDFTDALPNYGTLGGRMQWAFRTAKVGKLAENVTNLAGVKRKYAAQLAKKTIQLKRDVEVRLCGDGDSVAPTATVGGKTRGLGVWLQNGAQTDQPVPASYRTPAASIDSTALASVTEALIQGVLTSVYRQTGQKRTFDTLCGPLFKGRFKDFTQYTSGSTNTQVSIRTYTTDMSGGKITSTIDVYEGDFGTLNLIPSLWLGWTSADALNTQTISDNRAYVLNMDMLEMVHKQKPQVTDLADGGGGKRGMVDTIYMLKCLNPLAHAKFAGTAA